MRYILILFTALFLTATLNAQIDVNINFNLDKQPAWGPTGYDYVEYYYLPDIETYYYVPQQRYYYYEKGNWIYTSNLPPRFSSYNIYNSYKVVVKEKNPWRNHKSYKKKYLTYKNRHDQKLIRDSRDVKYFVNKNHPEHNNWVKQQKSEKAVNKEYKNDNRQTKHDKGKNKK